MVKDGVIKTTPLTSILNGITRQTVMDYFKHQGQRSRQSASPAMSSGAPTKFS